MIHSFHYPLLFYPRSGYAWRKLGRYDAAIADYSRSLELEPDNIKTLNNRGYSYAKSGAYDAAIGDYSRVIALDPSNAHAYHNRGISYDKKGLYEAAIAGEQRSQRACFLQVCLALSVVTVMTNVDSLAFNH